MVLYISLIFVIIGSTLVFYRLSPYFSALGLVIVSVFGCVVLRLLGKTFVAMVLLLVYMGGMLVVFAYSSVISAERFPAIKNLREVVGLSVLLRVWIFITFDNFQDLNNNFGKIIKRERLVGRRSFYKVGGLLVVIGVFILLVALVGALVISRGIEKKIVQAI